MLLQCVQILCSRTSEQTSLFFVLHFIFLYPILFMYSSPLNGQGYFQLFVIVNNAALNVATQASGHTSASEFSVL